MCMCMCLCYVQLPPMYLTFTSAKLNMLDNILMHDVQGKQWLARWLECWHLN